jgi:DNA invertase Pin-like site-specific DNA recombinase
MDAGLEAAQVNPIREALSRLGIDQTKAFVLHDQGPGLPAEKTGYDWLMDHIQSGTFSVLAVHDCTRISPQPQAVYNLIDAAVENDCRFISCAEGMDSNMSGFPQILDRLRMSSQLLSGEALAGSAT